MHSCSAIYTLAKYFDVSVLQNCDEPLVTVAMPIYNVSKYLRPAVLSIMQQTLTDSELYIIDDGSTDDALS